MKETIDHAEESLRSRLHELSDGIWRHIEYQEVSQTGDGGVYKACLEMKRRDNHLIFNVSGNPPAGMFNCTFSAIRGELVTAVLPMFSHDIPLALRGIYRVMEINAKENIIIVTQKNAILGSLLISAIASDFISVSPSILWLAMLVGIWGIGDALFTPVHRDALTAFAGDGRRDGDVSGVLILYRVGTSISPLFFWIALVFT